MKNINSSEWVEFANWLRAEAEKRKIPLSAIQPYAGFWAKVSSARIRQVPKKVIKSVEKHFRRSLEELANEAGIALFAQVSTIESGNNFTTALPVLTPEHEISLIWSDGVPDHMWPYIALKRGYFSDARIKATLLDAECSSDFPEGYGEAMQSCLPKKACGAATWNEMHELRGWPIAITHLFTGFAAIGRAPSRIKPLERNSSREFAHLVYQLSRRNIPASRIGCITENSIEFLQIAFDLGRACSADIKPSNIPIDKVQVAIERTPNLLEELYELGDLGWDVVVGHALTQAIAIQNPERYQIYFTWDRVRAIAEKINSPLAAKLNQLSAPSPFLLNHEPTNEDRALVCRLWSVAYRASKSIIGNMPPSDAAELINWVGSMLPYSNPNDIPVTPTVLSSAWHKSYQPLTLEQMLQPIDLTRNPKDRHSSLGLALKWVNEEKIAAEELLETLTKKSLAKENQACDTAREYMELGNFYDAKLILEAAL